MATAEKRLWSDRGAEARDYLAHRGLSEVTIRRARLGYRPDDEWIGGIFPDSKVWVPRGILIPWFEGPDITLINVRRPEGDPKYVAVRGSHRGGLYPSREAIVTGKPVVIVEGEFDALLLGQEIHDSAPVVTLGAASGKPSFRVKNTMLGATPWIVAGDADAAGEKAAEGWLSLSDRCVRVAPPAGTGKDWTEAYQKGLDLASWWRETLHRISGRPSRPEHVEPIPETQPDAYQSIPDGYSVVDGVLVADPPPCPWRDPIREWPDEWRLRWGGLANAYCHEGMDWREAEVRAAIEVTAERKVARGGPPPVMVPDIHTALWRDFLDEMVASGEAARFLSPAEFLQAQARLTTKPLDLEAIRSSALAVMSRDRAERNRAAGIPGPLGRGRWRCGNRYCRNQSGWWMSEHGVVRCLNCCLPAFSGLVVARGDAEDAPLLEFGRSQQARAPYPTGNLPPTIPS